MKSEYFQLSVGLGLGEHGLSGKSPRRAPGGICWKPVLPIECRVRRVLAIAYHIKVVKMTLTW